jgi:hypothetical protein
MTKKEITKEEMQLLEILRQIEVSPAQAIIMVENDLDDTNSFYFKKHMENKEDKYYDKWHREALTKVVNFRELRASLGIQQWWEK